MKKKLLLISFILISILSMNVTAQEPTPAINIYMDIAPPSEFLYGSIGLVDKQYQFQLNLFWTVPLEKPIHLTNCKIRIVNTKPGVTLEPINTHLQNIEVSISGGSTSFPIEINDLGEYRLQFILFCDYEGSRIFAYDKILMTVVSQTEFRDRQLQEDRVKILREHSDKQFKYYIGSLIAAGLLAVATFLMVFLTYITTRQMSKDREAELLRRRLGGLYSMLRWHSDIIIKSFKPPFNLDNPEDYRVKFFRDFRQNLYLGSNELVDIADKYFKFVDKNKIEADEEETFNELRKSLADQVNEDYDKYLKKLMKLTSRKPNWILRILKRKG